MSEPHHVNKAVDGLQQRITEYACALNYSSLTPEAIQAAKVRIIDILGVLIGGFFSEPAGIARNLAAQMPNAGGATVIGTRIKTTPDMAAFVNATTGRFVELMDTYHWPGSHQGHPSDTVTPVLALAEHAGSSGRDFITAVVLAYEIYLRMCDVYHNEDFDHTNLCCLATAVAGGKLLGLSPAQLSHCISMAVVPNVILRQVRLGHLSMFKAAISGQAGRGGVFAALLARAGMEGPHLPFEGKAGWCDHVAHERLALTILGGNGTPFRIPDSQIKNRPAPGVTISSILAAEKVAPLRNLKDVQQVTVEVFKYAKDEMGTAEHHWHPDTRESADHSVPYVVAATLIDGTITPNSYNDAHLRNPELRALLKKIVVVENSEFTRDYERVPQAHRTRVTVVTASGERLVGETGGDEDDLATPKSNAKIEEKFRGLTEDFLGKKRVDAILDRLWHLEDMGNVAEIPPAFVLG